MISQLWQRIVELTRSRRLDRESAEELAYHVEALVAEKRCSGLDEAEARRQARLELGSAETTREQLAERRTGFALEQTAREVG